jgi:hypothetical protein
MGATEMTTKLTREQAKIWCDMRPEQRELTPIPEENFDVVRAYADGKEIKLVGWDGGPEDFTAERSRYEIIEPKWKPKGHSYLFTTSATFHTQDECDKVKKATYFYIKLWQLAIELNDSWEPDWSDYNQKKYFVFFDHEAGEWRFEYFFTCNNLTPAFKSKEAAKKAIEIIERGDLDEWC